MADYIYLMLTVTVNALALSMMWGKLVERVNGLTTKMDTFEKSHSEAQTHINTIETSNERLSVALWGIDGQNGLRGNLKELSVKVDSLSSDVQSIKGDIRSMEEKLRQVVDLLHER